MASDVRLEPLPEPVDPHPPNKVGECGCCRYGPVRVTRSEASSCYVCHLCEKTVVDGLYDSVSEEIRAGNFNANIILAELRRKK